MSQDPSKKPDKDRGRSRVRATAAGGTAVRSGSKRLRGSSDDHDRERNPDAEFDPDYLIDKLLGSLSSDESLLDRFIQHLFQQPVIQSKITEQMSTAAANAVAANISDTTEDSGQGAVSTLTASKLADSVDKLVVAVNKLSSDLVASNQRCDDLEQYSRRNNIIISNIPVNNETTLETQVCNVLNDYIDTPIEPTDIERTHRIYRKASKTTSDKPPDIIVKFQSYRSRARILTKEPMVLLKTANELKPDKDKIYISEDLTKVRKELFYKTRTLKKKGHIKSTFTRDGKIIANIDEDNRWYINSQSDLEAMCAKHKMPVPQLSNHGKSKKTSGATGIALGFEPTSVLLTQNSLDTSAGIFMSQVPRTSLLR